MAWNEPGNENKDPWGRRKNEQGPPDLDEIVKKVQDTLGNLFGGGGGSKNGGSSRNDDGDEGGEGISGTAISVIAAILLIIWGLFGLYMIQPAEVGVVTQFGRFKEITQQGLNWHWPYPIEEVQTVNVEQVRVKNHKALMLTEDENIVEIELNVQYRIINAKDYLFNVQEPDSTLLQATESALREIVGTSDMDGVLTNERTRVATETKVLIQDILDRYKTGLTVISVNMQNAQPPAAVQAAFADVIKAREDEERSKNKAHAYANEVVEKASGFADQLREESQAYKAQVVARAEGETKRFLSILTEYEKAPDITRQRLYFESMETVLSNSSKVMIDVQGNNLMVLPLDSILNNAAHNTIPEPRMNQPESSRLLAQPEDMHKDPRSRGGR
ncbi:MAG TPA: FtsH protease activity modulator HflK [Gammaproteobacteria bacterium]|nr:FtsH protease activity modulator HflK [Gammaproteobacteria bacterium]